MLGKDCRLDRLADDLGGRAPSEGTNSDVNCENQNPAEVSLQPDQTVLAKMEEVLVKSALPNAMHGGVGVDVETVTNPCFTKPSFIERNYTNKEQEQCAGASRSFAGRWAGKEAVVKALGNSGARLKGAGAALQEIELLTNDDGTISVKLHGYAASEAQRVGIARVQVSLSYAENLAVAAAVPCGP